jgi:hypothetical protein
MHSALAKSYAGNLSVFAGQTAKKSESEMAKTESITAVVGREPRKLSNISISTIKAEYTCKTKTVF